MVVLALFVFPGTVAADGAAGKDEGFLRVGGAHNPLGDMNNVDFSNDDPESSGEADENLIPVRPPPKALPKSRPDATPEPEVERTSFKPVDLAFEHKLPVTDQGESHTARPDDAENELIPERVEEKETVALEAAPARTAHEPAASPAEHGGLFDNGVVRSNDTDAPSRETTERTRREGLSNIAKIGIAMGAILAFWLLLCPIVCIVCRSWDKKREKRALESNALKNANLKQQHPLMGDLVVTELGIKDGGVKDGGKPASKKKEKPHKKDAKNADELKRLGNAPKPSNALSNKHSGIVRKPGMAPLASVENLDTEV